MSSRATGISSFMHRYCCFRREPQVLCSRLKEMALDASVAEKSFTGMDTRPNEMVNEAMDRAAMLPPASFSIRSNLHAPQRLLQALLAAQGVAPAVPRLREALGRVGDPEIQRVRACKLFPVERHRHRRARSAPGRIGHVQRLAADVHIVVHKDFPRSLGHAPLQ